MQIIDFTSELFEEIKKGNKNSTVRKSIRGYTLGEVSLRNVETKEVVPGIIHKIEGYLYGKLINNKEYIKELGYKNADEFKASFEKIYPDINNRHLVTIVFFDNTEL